MVRKSLIVAVLVAVASPLAAQEEWTWTSMRPDGATPLGVTNARTISTGEIRVNYQLIQRNSLGVWFGKDSLDLATTLGLYEVAPLSSSDKRHTVMLSYGLNERLTLGARAEFAMLEREQLRDDGTFFITSANALGDVVVDATYNVLLLGPYRMDASLGAVLPLGKAVTRAVSPFSALDALGMPLPEVTPYDMRPGSGSFGLVGGASFDTQNEFGSVGGQFKMRMNLNENSRGYTLGDRYEASGWAAYNVNQSFSVSAGIRWEKWGNIDGRDAELDAIRMRDPHNDAVFLGGLRASMPLGINFVIPGNSQLTGHRISMETQYTLHHDYEGPQLGLDWGLNLGYEVPIS